jgi:hypothetical protein
MNAVGMSLLAALGSLSGLLVVLMVRVVILGHGTESIVGDTRDIEAEKGVETRLEETQVR